VSDPGTVARNAELRAWAVERGLLAGQRTGRIPSAVRERYRLYLAGEDPDEPGFKGPDQVQETPRLIEGETVESIPTMPGVVPEPDDDPFASAERRPRPAKPQPERAPRGLVGRLRGARKPADLPARGAPKRTSLAGLIGSAWGLASKVLASDPQSLPVARVLALQAPVAGVIVDRLARDTIVDRLLQPLARMGDKGEVVYALIAPPILTAMITQQPASFPVLAPLLAEALEAWADIAGPELKKQRDRAERRRAEGIDGQQLLESLFAVQDEGGHVGHDGQAAA